MAEVATTALVSILLLAKAGIGGTNVGPNVGGGGLDIVLGVACSLSTGRGRGRGGVGRGIPTRFCVVIGLLAPTVGFALGLQSQVALTKIGEELASFSG